jgi:hypothetical protein
MATGIFGSIARPAFRSALMLHEPKSIPSTS